MITEALRIDLGNSSRSNIAEPAQIEGALRRMQRDPQSLVDAEGAREIALRENLKAVIAGSVGALGSRYLLTAEIFGATDRRTLAMFRQTAPNADQLLPATERLSRSIAQRPAIRVVM